LAYEAKLPPIKESFNLVPQGFNLHFNPLPRSGRRIQSHQEIAGFCKVPKFSACYFQSISLLAKRNDGAGHDLHRQTIPKPYDDFSIVLSIEELFKKTEDL